MQFLRFLLGIKSPAHHCDNPIIVPKWGRDVETGKTLRRRPYHRITVAKDHIATLLDLMIGEEGIQPLNAMPKIHDQELTCAIRLGMSIMRQWNVDHVADVAQGFCSRNAVGIASGHIVDVTGFLQRSGGKRSSNSK